MPDSAREPWTDELILDCTCTQDLPATVPCQAAWTCHGIMVPRTGKHGPFAGCSEYPKCRYTMNAHEFCEATRKAIAERAGGAHNA